ncbi:Gfo/Idh/MocA family oxidoreductase [Actinokineospora bangkokensis]|uniref:Oxidoreductase n=1 Tax=Actinokineospora bangkokensis TaxID=1193682 RepID=A0A1Q9LRE3_9PSEU|nr:Gfo/Idh/MocA family oxidoreductase [Actinokineospora bangkokensis]OLR94590.1 hypothetical protein BJP25_12710 [Actinokineospora bangkokensis]
MSDTTRVAVIGYGLAGSAFHAPFVDAVDGLRVSAVVTGDPTRAATARERHPGVAVHASADELWRRADEVDLVVVASPNRFHAEHAHAAIAAGLPVVVDKPVAATAAEVRGIAEAAAAAGVLFTAFQNRRWDGDFRTVRALLDEGRLGRVTRFESRFERGARPLRHTWRESTDPADFAGIAHDLGAHLVDQAIVLFGRPTGVLADLRSPRPEVDAVEDATIQLVHGSSEHGDDVRSYLRMSNANVPVAPRFAVTSPTAGYRSWGLDPQEAASRSGVLPTAPGFGKYPEERWGTLLTTEDETTVPTLKGDYLAFYRGVLAALRGEGPAPVDPADSVQLAEVIEAALRSAETGLPVAL